MERPLAPGDIARVFCGPSYQDHPIKAIDGKDIYISSSPDFSLLVPGPDGSYQVQGINTQHSVQFIYSSNIPLTGNSFVDLVILEKLDDDSLKNVCVSNKYVAGLCLTLWKNRLLRTYGHHILDRKPDTLGYREYYFSLDTASPISAGSNHTIVLDQQGKVYAFGNNECGQLGLGDNVNRNVPTMVTFPFPHRIQSVACGGHHTIFLDVKGQVYTCGNNRYGQLGLGHDDDRNVPTLVTFPFPNRIQRVACGDEHTMFLDFEGQVYSCGDNYHGELGLGRNVNRDVPTLVQFPKRIRDVACGECHTVFLDVEGHVYACGYNESGQLGLGDDDDRNVPTVVPIPDRIRDVACGYYHTIFLDVEGNVYACGSNQYGQLGLGNDENRDVPTLVTFPCRIRAVACGFGNTVFLDVESQVHTCGSNRSGQLGLENVIGRNTPTRVTFSRLIRIVSCGCPHTVFIDIEGQVYACGTNRHGQLGLEDNMKRNVPTIIHGLIAQVY